MTLAHLRGVAARIKRLFLRESLDQRLAEEVRFHIDMETEANLRRGMAPGEARRAALIAFGGAEQWKEATRDEYRMRMLDETVQDLRQAWRGLARTPGFTLIAVAILGLGIGATTTMFSLLNGVLLRPLPYDDPDRLVSAWESNRAAPGPREGVSAVVFQALREEDRTFSDVAAWRPWGFELEGTEEPERLRGARVSASLFNLLGVRPIVGRAFAVGEDLPGADPAVLLSEEIWRRRFGADARVVGTTVQLNGRPHTIVGVIPAGFVLPEADVWVPLIFAPYEVEQRGNRALSIVARLTPGGTVQSARDQARAIVARLEAEAPAAHAGWDIGLESLRDSLVGATRTPLHILFAATCLVLLTACANLAGLLLVRSAARRREIALRVALGANRSRVVRPVVTEAMMLVGLAALVGVGLAQVGITGFVSQAGAWLPAGTTSTISPAVLLFVAAMTIIAGATLAVLPAMEAVRLDLQEVIKPTGTAPRRGLGLRDVTTASQVAFALMLLVCGGLLVRSFVQAQRVDPGFTARGVVAMTMSLPGRYAEPDQRVRFFSEVESRVTSLDGVAAAGFASHVPLSGSPVVTDFVIEGRAESQPGAMTAQLVNVTRGYFETLRIPLIAGRGFLESDRLGSVPVIVIDAEMARRHWPVGNAVGQRIRVGATLGADTAWRTVIGIAGSVRTVSIERAPEPAIYIPHSQNPWPSMSLAIRASRVTGDIARAAAAEVHALDPTRPVYAVRYVEDMMRRLLAPRLLQMRLMSGFAGTVLIIAVLGIYGLLAHAVSQRTRELGLRMALGARRAGIIWYCLRRALTRMAAGLAVGLVATLAATRLLAGVLFGLGPWDPFTWFGATLLLLIAGLIASALPALRAARLDPVSALRKD